MWFVQCTFVHEFCLYEILYRFREHIGHCAGYIENELCFSLNLRHKIYEHISSFTLLLMVFYSMYSQTTHVYTHSEISEQRTRCLTAYFVLNLHVSTDIVFPQKLRNQEMKKAEILNVFFLIGELRGNMCYRYSDLIFLQTT